MKKYFANPFFYSSLAAVVILGLIISSYVLGWTTAPPNPPSGNLSAPLNVGSTNQSKTGYLAIGTSTSPSFPLDVAGVLRVGSFSSAPTGAAGAIYYNATTNKFQGYQNGAWTDIGGSTFNPPPGIIAIFARSECPTGWFRVSDLDNKLPVGSITYGQSVVIPNVSSYAASSYKAYGLSVIWCAWGGLPPSQVVATGQKCHTKAKISWTAPNNNGSDITSYKIYKNGVLLDTVSSSTLSYTATGLTDGTSYTFNVSAVNSVGESAQSSNVNITPGYILYQFDTDGTKTGNSVCASYGFACVSIGTNLPNANDGKFYKMDHCSSYTCSGACTQTAQYPDATPTGGTYTCSSAIAKFQYTCGNKDCNDAACPVLSDTRNSWTYAACDCL